MNELLKSTWEALLLLAGGFVGSFLGSYLRKKAENLAIHEDIGKLVEQVRAVTTAAKEIEAKISGDVWDRQRRWELKREILFQATKRLADLEEALLRLDSMYTVMRKGGQESDASWAETTREILIHWREASAALDETQSFLSVICSAETERAFREFATLMNQISSTVINGEDANVYQTSRAERDKKAAVARAAVRRELGINGSA